MEKMTGKGTLYLIPSTLGDGDADHTIPAFNYRIIVTLKYFIVEELRTARRFMKKLCPDLDLDTIQFMIFNEHSDKGDIHSYIAPAKEGKDIGLLSEAGTPCIADPGSELVALAHEKGIKVVPLTGPSSLILALMASGFNGQNFIFHGYLPVEKLTRSKKIKEIERQIFLNNQTQIFIETPYRNQQMFQALLETCSEGTLLCLACDLTTEAEFIKVKPIREWKKLKPDINKRPCVFLLYK
jgi:16S rRNA (cytidine1402-2'-O)-methyltransferase